jgi:hypothetical protein
MSADAEERSYIVRVQLNEGSTKETRFKTKRERTPGEIVNLPMDSDGSAKPGKGFLWRVTSIERHDDPSVEAVLMLVFERPHTGQE